MNVVFKKYNFIAFVLTILLSSAHAFGQDLFDGSFLEDPENKSISVKSSEQVNSADKMEKEEKNISPAPVLEVVGEDKNVPLPPVLEQKKSLDEIVKTEKSKAILLEGFVEKAEKVEEDQKSPSEKVIGSISKEVFQEMADLEKENSILNLQLKQEKIKNEINEVKSAQRQALMAEIEKREMAARAKVEWEREQEVREIEIWERRQKAELLSKQIESIIAGEVPVNNSGEALTIAPSQQSERTNASEIYYIVEIRGLGNDLVAKLADDEEKKVFFVKKDSFLPTGHQVVQVNKDYVKLSLNGKEEVIGFSVIQSD